MNKKQKQEMADFGNHILTSLSHRFIQIIDEATGTTSSIRLDFEKKITVEVVDEYLDNLKRQAIKDVFGLNQINLTLN